MRVTGIGLGCIVVLFACQVEDKSVQSKRFIVKETGIRRVESVNDIFLAFEIRRSSLLTRQDTITCTIDIHKKSFDVSGHKYTKASQLDSFLLDNPDPDVIGMTIDNDVTVQYMMAIVDVVNKHKLKFVMLKQNY